MRRDMSGKVCNSSFNSRIVIARDVELPVVFYSLSKFRRFPAQNAECFVLVLIPRLSGIGLCVRGYRYEHLVRNLKTNP